MPFRFTTLQHRCATTHALTINTGMSLRSHVLIVILHVTCAQVDLPAGVQAAIPQILGHWFLESAIAFLVISRILREEQFA